MKEAVRRSVNWVVWVLSLFMSVAAVAQESIVFQAAGDDVFTVPDRVNEVVVEVWGAGGSGGGVTERGVSGGGGGGAYARSRMAVEPGDQLTIRVGAGGTASTLSGDSWVIVEAQIIARAEAGTDVPTNESEGGRAGRASQSVGNEARFSGGFGADGIVRGFFGRLQGGGGGSSAGLTAAGADGDEDAGGIAPVGGGNGGDGSDTAGLSSSNGSPGSAPGGGGGGATTRAFFGGDFPGGVGGDGQVRISYTPSAEPEIDHFEIVHDGVALNCQPETVTIRACATADCNGPDGLFTDPVTATLAPANGWVDGNPVTFSGGVGQATLQNTTAGIVTLDVVGSQPSSRPQSVTLCDNGSGSLSSNQCRLEFFQAGLAFDVPDLISHRPSGAIQVQAVRQDEQSQACVPAFENVTRTVQFWSTYSDPGPADRPASRPVGVNGSDVSGNSGNPTALDLDFGPGGIAEIDVTYPDAGLMQLDARYSGSAATDDEDLVMPGADQFRSRPAGLCVRTGGECASGDSSCPLFVRADEEFDLSIKAVGWQSAADTDLCVGNPVTPNFLLSDIPLAASVFAPSGGEDGVFEPESYTHTRSASATETVRARVSEVGVFEFSAVPAAGAYLGLTVDSGTSQPTGRFYPDRFSVVVDPGEFEAGCSSGAPFTYTGQEFGWFSTPGLAIEPLSLLGARTENYTAPGFLRLTDAGVARTFPAQDATTADQAGNAMMLDSGVSTGVLSVIAPGLLNYTYDLDDSFNYVKTAATKIAPFGPDLPFTVDSITDTDGVSAGAAPYSFTPLADFEIYYGRLAMENVYGPENISQLRMPFRLDYWNGNRFALNASDSCTDWTTADISNTANHHTLVGDSGDFSAGEAGPLILQPDGSQGTDTLVWAVEEWLRDDLDGDGSLDDPFGLATFGVFRGHDRVIYWQER
ncbi:MAG: DUF6701 domain-containing protein [Marinobacter adhaerens]